MTDADRFRQLHDKLKPSTAPDAYRLPAIEEALREVLTHLALVDDWAWMGQPGDEQP